MLVFPQLLTRLTSFGASLLDICHTVCVADGMVEVCLHNAVHDVSVTVSTAIKYFISLCVIACPSSSLHIGLLSGRRENSRMSCNRGLYMHCT